MSSQSSASRNLQNLIAQKVYLQIELEMSAMKMRPRSYGEGGKKL